ncbi:MAG: BadF/BadG/BcrA/BcrD ATPase family protein [Acidobacteriaceae bacterium]|nr:BadF/BadG/BcrA/BcrD ATPase family protein [Acidobacteriaceae bacterium]
MGYFLALDAGGTKTTALLADENSVLARAQAETIKLLRTTEQDAETRLTALLQELSAKAGVPLSKIDGTCMGTAGYSIDKVREWSYATLRKLAGGTVAVCGDEEIALDAGFPGAPGILVIAGTGSNIVGRCADGTLHSAGGWGPVLGDEGSGYWIGLEAIRSALRAQDRGVHSGLLEAILRHWNLPTLQDLILLANRQPLPDFSALARIVAECAEGGDALALGLLKRAGEELADAIAVVHSKMLAAQCGVPVALGVAYTGSVMSHILPVRRAMIAQLQHTLPGAKVLDGPVDPLDGALWRARNLPRS